LKQQVRESEQQAQELKQQVRESEQQAQELKQRQQQAIAYMRTLVNTLSHHLGEHQGPSSALHQQQLAQVCADLRTALELDATEHALTDLIPV
jgi:uncharacterized coiled-coil DUF342 family protein